MAKVGDMEDDTDKKRRVPFDSSEKMPAQDPISIYTTLAAKRNQFGILLSFVWIVNSRWIIAKTIQIDKTIL